MFRLDEKIALVTGAAGGLGSAIGQALAACGATVVLTDRAERASADVLSLDVCDEGQWRQRLADVIARHGRLDILVNNAGVAPHGRAIEELSLNDWQKVIDINLTSVFLGVKHGIRAMKARGGAIINISSIMGLVGCPLQAEYGAAKGGVTLLTKSAAVECTALGYAIRVNSVHPGFADTGMVRDAIAARVPAPGSTSTLEERVAALGAAQPLGRLFRPEEIAALVAFLASDQASGITGGQFTVDGGYTAQ